MHSQRPSLKVLQFPEDGRRVMKYGNHRASPGLEGEIRERLAAGDAEDTHRRARQEGESVPVSMIRVNNQDRTNIFEIASLVSLISAPSKTFRIKMRAMKRIVAPVLTAMPTAGAG